MPEKVSIHPSPSDWNIQLTVEEQPIPNLLWKGEQYADLQKEWSIRPEGRSLASIPATSYLHNLYARTKRSVDPVFQQINEQRGGKKGVRLQRKPANRPLYYTGFCAIPAESINSLGALPQDICYDIAWAIITFVLIPRGSTTTSEMY